MHYCTALHCVLQYCTSIIQQKKMSSGQKRPAWDGATNLRRSSRPRKPRDLFHREVLVNDGKEVEFRVDERRGLQQPGEYVPSAEEKQKLNKESVGLKLVRDFLQPAGWRCKKRTSRDEIWVYVAPGVTMKKEIPNVNMFASALKVYEQFEKDGYSMYKIIRRAKEAEAEAESDTDTDTDRSGNHTSGVHVARAPAAATATTTTTTDSATNITSSNVCVVTPTAATTRPNNAAAAPAPGPASVSTNAINNSSNHPDSATAAAPVVQAMAAAKREDICTIDLSSVTDTPPPQPVVAQPMTIPQRVRKLEKEYILDGDEAGLNIRERIENLERELGMAVGDSLRIYQRVARLEAANRE